MFTPVVPLDGVPGWRFLEATETAQRESFNQSPLLEREVEYFKENIGSILTAEELVADRTLLKVALGAFGLDDDLFKRGFIQQILEGGSEDANSLANRFVDSTYSEFSQAFGFGDLLGVRTGEIDFGERITSAYRERQFEVAIGDSNEDMRLALNFRREIAEVTSSGQSEETKWLLVLGNEPMREVIEKALNLPSEFSSIDLDQQVETLMDRASSVFGDSSPDVFADPEAVDRAINRFLVRSQIEDGPTSNTPGFGALTLLQNANLGNTGLQNLILSSIG